MQLIQMSWPLGRTTSLILKLATRVTTRSVGRTEVWDSLGSTSRSIAGTPGYSQRTRATAPGSGSTTAAWAVGPDPGCTPDPPGSDRHAAMVLRKRFDLCLRLRRRIWP